MWCLLAHTNMFVAQKAVVRKNNYIYGALMEEELGKDGLGCFLYDKLVVNGDKVFQVDGINGDFETYKSILQRSVRVALEIRARRVTEKDIILLCCENTMDSFIPFCAGQFLNAKLCAIDPNQSVHEVAHLLGMMRPKICFVQNDFVSIISDALTGADFNMEIVVMNDDEHHNSFKNFLTPKSGETEFKPKPCKDRNETAIIIFSHGVTGMPKGVCCSGYSLINNALAMHKIGINAHIGIHYGTFYWITSYTTTILVIISNGYKVVVPKRDIKLFMKATYDYNVTFAFGSSTLPILMTEEHVEELEFKHLQNLMVSGFPISEDHLRKCRELLPNTYITEVYVQSEVPGAITAFSPARFKLALNNLGSVGQPVPGLVIKIVDVDTEKILRVNQQGEIRFKTKWPFKGCYNLNSGHVLDKEGFIKTGDLGYFNESNCLYITGRLKEMLIYQCWHMSPTSIEQVILQHSAVKEAVVVGKPHPEDGHHLMAVVTLRETHKPTNEEEILCFANSRLSNCEKLRGGVTILEEFPKTPFGKISRWQVKNIVLNNQVE